jgi:hypothetical protein
MCIGNQKNCSVFQLTIVTFYFLYHTKMREKICPQIKELSADFADGRRLFKTICDYLRNLRTFF